MVGIISLLILRKAGLVNDRKYYCSITKSIKRNLMYIFHRNQVKVKENAIIVSSFFSNSVIFKKICFYCVYVGE